MIYSDKALKAKVWLSNLAEKNGWNKPNKFDLENTSMAGSKRFNYPAGNGEQDVLFQCVPPFDSDSNYLLVASFTFFSGDVNLLGAHCFKVDSRIDHKEIEVAFNQHLIEVEKIINSSSEMTYQRAS